MASTQDDSAYFGSSPAAEYNSPYGGNTAYGSSQHGYGQASTSQPIDQTHTFTHSSPHNMPRGLGGVLEATYPKRSKDKFERLDERFRVRNKAFFSEGRVFAVIMNETAGNHNPTSGVTDYNSSQSLNEVKWKGNIVYTNNRRFIVVRQKREFCFACPIFTYSNRGTTKAGVKPAEHTIAYSQGQQPQLLPGETGITKAPIEIVMAEGEANLNVASRIYFGIHHPIQYNVKVKEIGYVIRAHIPNLIGYWKEIDGQEDTKASGLADDKTVAEMDEYLYDTEDNLEGYHPKHNPHGYHPTRNPAGYHEEEAPFAYHEQFNPYGYHDKLNRRAYHPERNAFGYHPTMAPHSYHPNFNKHGYHNKYNPHGYHPVANPYGFHPEYAPDCYHPEHNKHGYHGNLNKKGYHPEHNPLIYSAKRNPHVYHKEKNPKGYHPSIKNNVYAYHPRLNMHSYHPQENQYGYLPAEPYKYAYHQEYNPHGYHHEHNRNGFHPQYNPGMYHPEYNPEGDYIASDSDSESDDDGGTTAGAQEGKGKGKATVADITNAMHNTQFGG